MLTLDPNSAEFASSLTQHIGFSDEHPATRFGESGERFVEQPPDSVTSNSNSGLGGPLFARAIDGGGGPVMVQDIGKG